MELIQLVMDMEDLFDIRIPDKEAEKLRTVGSCYDLLLLKIRENPESEMARRADLEEYVWHKLATYAAKLSKDAKPEQITRETDFFTDLDFGG